jgi:hypothetical protein
MLAYDYPLLGFFWTMLIIYVWIALFFLLFRIIADIFRSHDLGGFAKALWLIFIIVVPWVGVIVYLIARGHSMAERQYEYAKARQSEFDSYVRETAGGASTADEINKLAGLKEQGVITDAEFAAQKAKLLA